MKFLIAGLGNIGPEYENTRHNIGFRVADAFVKLHNADSPGKLAYTLERHAMKSSLKIKGRTYIIIKPTTYMNLSGKAVNYWMQQENIPVGNILVITDDLALPFGTLRLKPKGSDGGHNGLKSIQENLGTENYARLRFGIGSDFQKGRQVDYVLNEWTEEEYKNLPERIELATRIIVSFGNIGIQRTMNEFNNK